MRAGILRRRLIIQQAIESQGPTGEMSVSWATFAEVNGSVEPLVAGYFNDVAVDVDSYVGQFRAGGPAGNLWDQMAAYDADDLHYIVAGYGQFAQACFDALRRKR